MTFISKIQDKKIPKRQNNSSTGIYIPLPLGLPYLFPDGGPIAGVDDEAEGMCAVREDNHRIRR